MRALFARLGLPDRFGIHFDVIDFGTRNIDEAGTVVGEVQAGINTEDAAPFVTDGEAVAKNRNVGGQDAGNRTQQAEGYKKAEFSPEAHPVLVTANVEQLPRRVTPTAHLRGSQLGP